MKKTYNKPTVEIEVYSLDTSIASTCQKVVTNGPDIGGHTLCEDYAQINPYSMPNDRSGIYHVNFYEDPKLCDCYTTAGNGQYWTS